MKRHYITTTKLNSDDIVRIKYNGAGDNMLQAFDDYRKMCTTNFWLYGDDLTEMTFCAIDVEDGTGGTMDENDPYYLEEVDGADWTYSAILIDYVTAGVYGVDCAYDLICEYAEVDA